MSRERLAENVYLSPEEDAVIILDQTRLPNEEEYLALSTGEEMVEALQSLRVRGAPAIGIFAAYGLYVLSQQIKAETTEEFCEQLHAQSDLLNSSRPTAANLRWALNRLERMVQDNDRKSPAELVQMIGDEAETIQREDIDMCRRIAENGLKLLDDADGILTHCNAGPIATSRYGTALGPVLLGKDQGMDFHVYADETRPLLQGARLTTYELQRAGVDVTLICDNMVSQVMKNGWIQAVLVGCDRIAMNGDVANKIGTSGIAILARHYDIPFYVLGPTSSIDPECPTGDGILIEMREGEEVRSAYYEQPMAPEGVPCYNPSFDVTDHELITAIVTEKGVFYPPFDQSLEGALS